MKLKNRLLTGVSLAVAMLAPTLAGNLRAADVITINWDASQGSLKPIAGLNGWSATDSTVAYTGSYRGSLGAMNPKTYRLHAAEILNASSHPKSWLNADGLTWNATKIQDVLNSVTPNVRDIIINIPRWPAAMASQSTKLPANKWADFANFCGSLANIVKAYPQVKYIEILNEVDGIYNGASDMTELMNLCIQARGSIRSAGFTGTLIPAPWTQPYDTDFNTFISLVNKDIFQAVSYHNYCTAGASTDLNYLYNAAEGIGSEANNIRNKLNAVNNGGAIKLFIGENNTYANYADDGLGYMRSNEGAVTVALTLRGCAQARVNGTTSVDGVQTWNDADYIYGVMDSSNYSLRQTGRLLKEWSERFSSGTESLSTSSSTSLRPFVSAAVLAAS